jgi:hypothetical protein
MSANISVPLYGKLLNKRFNNDNNDNNDNDDSDDDGDNDNNNNNNDFSDPPMTLRHGPLCLLGEAIE